MWFALCVLDEQEEAGSELLEVFIFFNLNFPAFVTFKSLIL